MSHPRVGHPARLVVGSPLATSKRARELVQEIWCPTRCGLCRTCIAIAKGSWSSAWWMTGYQSIGKDAMGEALSLWDVASSHEPFALIVQEAERLTQATATQLLKRVEEPPAGAHLILTTTDAHLILGPLRSRCMLEHVAGESEPVPVGWITLLSAPCHTQIATCHDLLAADIPSCHEIAILAQAVVQRIRHEVTQTSDPHRAAALAGVLDWWYRVLDEPIPAGSEKAILQQGYMKGVQLLCNQLQLR